MAFRNITLLNSWHEVIFIRIQLYCFIDQSLTINIWRISHVLTWIRLFCARNVNAETLLAWLNCYTFGIIRRTVHVLHFLVKTACIIHKTVNINLLDMWMYWLYGMIESINLIVLNTKQKAIWKFCMILIIIMVINIIKHFL
jgi:hypothetical protein